MEAIIYWHQFHASLGCFAVPPGLEVLLRFQLKGTITTIEHILFGWLKWFECGLLSRGDSSGLWWAGMLLTVLWWGRMPLCHLINFLSRLALSLFSSQSHICIVTSKYIWIFQRSLYWGYFHYSFSKSCQEGEWDFVCILFSYRNQKSV